MHVYEKLPLLRNIEKRIAKWTQLPEENGEHFYLVKEQEGNIAKNFHVGKLKLTSTFQLKFILSL